MNDLLHTVHYTSLIHLVIKNFEISEDSSCSYITYIYIYIYIYICVCVCVCVLSRVWGCVTYRCVLDWMIGFIDTL
jgi:hypothetical protein